MTAEDFEEEDDRMMAEAMRISSAGGGSSSSSSSSSSSGNQDGFDLGFDLSKGAAPLTAQDLAAEEDRMMAEAMRLSMEEETRQVPPRANLAPPTRVAAPRQRATWVQPQTTSHPPLQNSAQLRPPAPKQQKQQQNSWPQPQSQPSQSRKAPKSTMASGDFQQLPRGGEPIPAQPPQPRGEDKIWRKAGKGRTPSEQQGAQQRTAELAAEEDRMFAEAMRLSVDEEKLAEKRRRNYRAGF
jgi:hypothetical protein